jgi:hypothetical protein
MFYNPVRAKELMGDLTGGFVRVFCKGSAPAYPAPTAQEIELQQLQLDAIKRQNSQYEKLAPYLYEEAGYNYDPGTGDVSKMTDEEMYASLTPGQRTQYDIDKALAERQQKAIAGTLELDPLATQKIQEREDSLHNMLSSRVGIENVEESQAWKDWQQEKTNLLQSMRRGEITTGESLLLQSQGLQNQNTQFRIGTPLSIRSANSDTIGLMGSAQQPYAMQRQGMYQSSLDAYKAKQASAAGWGKLAGMGLMAAGTALGGPLGGLAAGALFQGVSSSPSGGSDYSGLNLTTSGGRFGLA